MKVYLDDFNGGQTQFGVDYDEMYGGTGKDVLGNRSAASDCCSAEAVTTIFLRTAISFLVSFTEEPETTISRAALTAILISCMVGSAMTT